MSALAWPRRREAAGPRLDVRSFDLMCLTAAVVLAAHAPHLPPWLSPALAVVLLLRWRQRRRQPGRVPWYLKLPLIALLAAAVLLGYGNLFGRESGAALAAGLLVLKLLESETSRDARVVTAFAGFALMSALLFDQGLAATLLVALGLVPVLATLRALEPARPPASLLRELLPGLALLGVALPLALLAFLLVPRLDSPLWGAPPARQARTGLGPEMSPGDFTDLLTDDSPALRVGFDGPPPPPSQRYFRAYVLWRYDGRSWAPGFQRAGMEPAPVEGGTAVSYSVSLEPSHQRVLPALDVPLAAPPQARMGPDRELLAEREVNDPRSYSLRSALGYRLQPQLDDTRRRLGLQLPRGFNPRAQALAAQWRQRYGADDMAIARAALTLFHDGGFGYTLAPPPLGRDAVDEFLFTTREGFCEHYASAFTVLMRAAGIPARVVTGYQGGYWNGLGNYLLVRQSDAHAWSEVWLAGRGWTRFDPTAAVRPERVSQGAAAAAGGELPWYRSGWLASVRNRWDVVNRWWNQGVIGFNALRQRGLLTPFGVRQADPATLGLLLAIGTTLFAAAGLAWALWRRRGGDELGRIMQELERKLSRRGLARRRGEGPRHYFDRAARALPAQRKEIERLRDEYLRLRYASELTPPARQTRPLRRAVRNFWPRAASNER